MGLKVVITGATGMVGKAVLLECLESAEVDSVLLVNRSPIGLQHAKLREVLHRDFSDFSAIEAELQGLDACFYCMGVSAFRKSEAEYARFTVDYTQAFLAILKKGSPQAVVIYVSGSGTDNSEKGRVMWARVKGRTENLILNAGFKDAYAFRPGFILPQKGVRSKTRLYQFFYDVLRPFYPLIKRLPSVVTSSELGRAMIRLAQQPQTLKHLENKDIRQAAKG